MKIIINQKMKYNNNELNNDKTLYDYGIMHESVLECIFQNKDGFQIFIKVPYRSSLIIFININTTIENIKELIYEKTGILLDNLRLKFGGKRLEDQRTIQDYNLQRGSTIYLV